ncbi:hypothetical protein G7046_g5593 [Stylonectria norvegica]|nr:hypothetical protein G7046_g5593 [Stylonectria norvegica]
MLQADSSPGEKEVLGKGRSGDLLATKGGAEVSANDEFELHKGYVYCVAQNVRLSLKAREDGSLVHTAAVLDDCKHGEPTKFNSSFHSVDEVPEHLEDRFVPPSHVPYNFTRWLPLILRTRGLDPSVAQVVKLTRAQAKILVDASGSSIITGVLDSAYDEDLTEEILPSLAHLRFPPQGLFVRVEGCSPKDVNTSVPDRMSLHCAADIILRLTLSRRARNEMIKALEFDGSTIDLTFLPFDDRMETQPEHRVFCSPKQGAITAVSQYCWNLPWEFSHLELSQRTLKMDEIGFAIKSLHQDILAELNPMDEQDSLLKRQGFSFDVCYNEEEKRAELVELNAFGARSGCGSCLFHWIEDFDLLYGIGEPAREVEFRIAIEYKDD